MTRAHLASITAVTVLSVAVASGLALLVTSGGEEPAPTRNELVAERFLEHYVTAEGRIIRHDQGEDTVSEGQAYAMLLAAATGDQERFETVWSWTQVHLERPDGLLSWRWADGSVVDDESASDANLDAARALVVAGQRFGDEELVAEGIELGRALLEHETVVTGAGRVLVAGTWATEAPYAVNPSYVSPVATTVLAEASADPRWSELEEGSRAVVEALVSGDRLPPDWAEVSVDGSVRATPGPGGEPERFGFDAARVGLRHAESCDEADRAIAASLTDLLTRDERSPATYDLAGSPQTGDTHPLAKAAVAASQAAAGDDAAARESLSQARAVQAENPTYYGGAWAALAPLMLTNPVLQGCPPLETP